MEIYVENINQLRDVLSKDYNEPVQIILKSGLYEIEEPVIISNKNNITIKGESGTIFYGGKHLNFEKHSGNTYVADLSDINIPKFQNRGCGFVPPEFSLMFYDGETPLTMSRYPKDSFYNIEKVVAGGTLEGEPSVFEYDDPEFDKFEDEKNLLLFGYFHWLWADATVKAYVNKDKKQVIIDPPYFYSNIYNLSMVQGPKCYALNLLSQLSSEGEYYLDYGNKKVYVYSKNLPNVEATALKGNMFVFENSHKITMDNIIFDMGQGQCIKSLGCNYLTVKNCEIKRFSADAMEIKGGHKCSFINNDIHHFGRSGLEIEAGDFETLTSCDFIVENNKIHDVGIIDSTYTPCIHFVGVGLTIRGNELYNAPSSVLRLDGNDSLFEYNEVHDAVTESDDQGTIDMFCNSAFRGNEFRYNFFHDNGVSASKIVTGCSGIRFDDIISGQRVYKNVFVNSSKGHFGAVQINSGRDNVIKENLIMNGTSAFSGGFFYGNMAWSKEYDNAKPPYSALYLERYPELKNCYDEKWEVKKDGYNIYGDNVIVNCDMVVSDKCYSDCERENCPDMHKDEIVINEEISLSEALSKIDFPKEFIEKFFCDL
ncbi:MAG: right-handed parallel beta-helix repeat-containing protein [Abditibacteriota bacterium]|nr:right-handed parallel beta-helix repeat-containing protein [Abditibacteriota bacterium]